MHEWNNSLVPYILVGMNAIFWLGLAAILMKRVYLALAVAPLLISIALRVQSVLYIDLFGPVNSSQLSMTLGPGTDSIYMIICYTVFFLPFLLVLETLLFRDPRNLTVMSATHGVRYTENSLYLILFVYFVVLYLQLFLGGVIPLIDHIERFDFAERYASPLHEYMFKYGTILAVFLGGQTVYTKLATGRYDRRAFIFIFVMLLYAVLTGHRFAAFNKFISFFLIPFSLVFAQSFHLRRMKLYQRDGKQGWLVLAVLIIGFSTAFFSILNSYSNVRTANSETVIARVVERLFVQQGELWIETSNRVQEDKQGNLSKTMDYLFFNPILPGKNTSIQYLMWLSLEGEAVRILDIGQQYAGGFPEIFVEIFGIYFLLPALMLFGTIMSMVTVIFLTSLRRGKLLSMLMSGFIMYAFVLTVYNGMLNQFFVLTFWLKLALLIVVYASPPMKLLDLRLFGLRSRNYSPQTKN